MKYPDLNGKVAIVTGASRGIGRAIAQHLLREGVRLIVNGTNVAALASLCKEAQDQQVPCHACPGDVSLPQTAEQLVSSALDHYGKIDILVNNAGINNRTPTLQMSSQDWLRVMDVNLNSCFYVTRAVLPVMAAAKSGVIINMSSARSKIPKTGVAVSYTASKAAINAMTKHWALEFAPLQVRVNAVCPGPILTDMSDQWTAEYREALQNQIPLGRFGHVDDVAAAVLYLASNQAGFVTGECLNVNGGTVMV